MIKVKLLLNRDLCNKTGLNLKKTHVVCT